MQTNDLWRAHASTNTLDAQVRKKARPLLFVQQLFLTTFHCSAECRAKKKERKKMMRDRRIDKRPLCFCAAGYKGGACGGWYGWGWIMCSVANNLQKCCSEDSYCMWMWVGWRTKSALVPCLWGINSLVQATWWPQRLYVSAFGFVT